LVGAGPGHPELITLKAVGLIRKADLVVYDYLVPAEHLEYARPESEKIYVGKKAGCHSLPQEKINRLLVEKASEGKVVVRLKGGDPFVFGRGGEEALALVEAGIPFEVVPGVTAGVAVPAFAGIPVTQRGITSTVAFITGHEDPEKETSGIDWRHLAGGIGTLVFYMGAGRLGKIAADLISHGADPGTPVAVIQRGTTQQQRTVTGTLVDIESRVREAKLAPPAIIVVGRVVSLREKLNWFESKPLFGRKVIVTRAREQASDFSSLLRELGAVVLQMPTIRIGESPEPRALKLAIENLDQYDWIVFTSANAVKKLIEQLHKEGRDVRALGKARLCAIGPATAAALQSSGLLVDLVPESYVAESVVECLRARGELSGKKILLPRAEKARKLLPQALRELGAEVTEIALYTTQLEKPENLEEVRKELAAGRIDVVTFTSSSTVENFISLIGKEEALCLAGKTVFASIGPVTSETASRYGLKVDIMPEDYTIEALAEAICSYFSGRS